MYERTCNITINIQKTGGGGMTTDTKYVSCIIGYFSGTAVMENSTLTTHKVFVYPGTLTWNEGLQTCQHYNQEMLDIDHDDMYSAVQSLITTYPALSVCVVLYGLHTILISNLNKLAF